MEVIFEGKHASNYDDWYTSPIGRFIDQVESDTALALFAPCKGMRVLDAGCGTGNFSLKLARIGCSVTGVDISAEMLNIARSKSPADLSLEYLQMDLHKLNFPDQVFDGVLSMAALEFIPDPLPVYQELYRVLKPGGKLLIGTINGDSSWGEIYRQQARENVDSIFRKAHFHTLKDLANLDPAHLSVSQGCLFIPPGLERDNYTWEEERRRAGTERPGFIILVWDKPKSEVG
jgi:ubiquinone/menaquinone biosynthesis C-methylase UbiE